MSGKKKTDNLLDFIPAKSNSLRYEIDSAGNVTLFRENKGFFNSFAQKFFKKPRFTQIHLDEMGNFIWPLINGTNDIYSIGNLVKEKFGDKAEPLFKRLVQYLKMMEACGFINLKHNSTK